MKQFMKRLHQKNKGFTLVELLIVVAILGILAAIVIPNFTGIIDEGEAEAAATEKAIVQTAMDVMMNRASISSVTLTTTTDDMSAFPTDNPLYPTYMRYATTTGNYSCSTTGLVVQEGTGY